MKVFNNHSLNSDSYNAHGLPMELSTETETCEVVGDNIVHYSKRSLKKILDVSSDMLETIENDAGNRDNRYKWTANKVDTSERTILVLTAIRK